jgi:hypothetical protein
MIPFSLGLDGGGKYDSRFQLMAAVAPSNRYSLGCHSQSLEHGTGFGIGVGAAARAHELRTHNPNATPAHSFQPATKLRRDIASVAFLLVESSRELFPSSCGLISKLWVPIGEESRKPARTATKDIPSTPSEL